MQVQVRTFDADIRSGDLKLWFISGSEVIQDYQVSIWDHTWLD